MEETGNDFPGDAAPVGYARMQLNLEKSHSVLAKSATGDTTFELDSLIIVLTASGASPVRLSQPISGRPDSGVISVTHPPVELPGLRNWTARFYTIDERTSPFRRDTVHLDSTVFAVMPEDTAFVLKTVSPAFAILRARIVSTNAAQVPDSVRFVRLRVDGVVRDSMVVGSAPPSATLNWVQAMTTDNIVHAVGNHGRVLRSANSGNTWTEIILTGAPAVVSGHFVSANQGYVLTRQGRLYHTTTGGVPPNQWNPAWIGDGKPTTADSVNALFMTGTQTGFAVGRNGGLYKTDNGGNSWYSNMVSNTDSTLNAVHFPTPNVGYVVGEGETILRTTNGSENKDSPPPSGVLWTPMSGGWFRQDCRTNSNNSTPTTKDVRALAFVSETRGWALGANGLVCLTTDGGTFWDERTGTDGLSANAVWFTSPTVGFVVGNGGGIRKTENNDYWWGATTSGTNRDLHDVRFSGTDTGFVVGANGTIRRTVNGSASTSAITWSTQNVPPGYGGRTLRGVFPVSGVRVYAVGDQGTILRTTNGGSNWSARPSNTTQDLSGVYFRTANEGLAVGEGGVILKTTDGGDTWSALTSGTTADLRTVWVVSADTAYVAGANGTLLKTVNGGTTWYSQGTSNTAQMNKLFFFNASKGYLVGNGGNLLNAVNQGDNWTGGGVKRSLKGVHFVSASTGWIVGDDGVILKTTDSARTWVEQHRQNGLMLHAVHFQNANTGWVTGANGEVFNTTNGGATWTQQTTIVTTIPLTWISFRNTSEGFIIGGTNSLYYTANGGSSWTAKFAGGLPGAKTFDQMLAYKYLKPGQAHTILIEAIDRLSPLRGYQSSFVLNIGAGQDTTIHRPLASCGNPTPACQ